MKAVWITRSFLDYRIPVYQELYNRLHGKFTLFYNADYVPQRCCDKVSDVLGDNAKGLHGELYIGVKKWNNMSNKGMRIPYQRGLIKAVLQEKPDVIISDGFFQWTYAALWLRAKHGIPHVMCYEKTAHTERNAQWYRTSYRKYVMRWIDSICCNGKLSGEYVQSLGFSKEKITYGHMVADVEKLTQKSEQVTEQEIQQKRSELKLNGIVFLYVGRFIPLKGLMYLLNAWRTFTNEVGSEKCSLLLIGSGPQESECQDYCKSNKLGNVCFTGEINYDQLPLFYRCADVFIISTLEDNWSLVVPEAMACGLPILCSKYNGCWPELVKPENGWVFDPLDNLNIVKILGLCIKDSKSLREKGRISKRIVKDHTALRAVDGIVEACAIASYSYKKLIIN